MAHIFLSHYGKACASLITLLADYQIGPFFKTLLVMFLDESSIVAYFATQLHIIYQRLLPICLYQDQHFF